MRRRLADLLHLHATATSALAAWLAPASVAPAHEPQPTPRPAVTHAPAVEQPQPTLH